MQYLQLALQLKPLPPMLNLEPMSAFQSKMYQNVQFGSNQQGTSPEPRGSSALSFCLRKSHTRSAPSDPAVTSRLLVLSDATPTTAPSCAGRGTASDGRESQQQRRNDTLC